MTVHKFQVCSVLDSLEREYKRDDDMLQKHLTAGDIDKVTLITQLISKHQEQKEAFLKACTLARRTAETFLKYSNRSLQFFSQPTQSTFKGPEAKVKGEPGIAVNGCHCPLSGNGSSIQTICLRSTFLVKTTRVMTHE